MISNQCKNCNSFKTESNSPRDAAMKGAGVFAVLGGVLCILGITAIFGLISLAVALIMWLAALSMPKTNEVKCLSCGNEFVAL